MGGCAPNLMVVKKTSEVKKEVPLDYPQNMNQNEDPLEESFEERDKRLDKEAELKKGEGEGLTEIQSKSSFVVRASQLKWQDFFNDSHLQLLIQSGLEKNQELKIFTQEIRIAKNEMMARQGEYLPRVGLGAEAGMEKVGEYTHRGATDSTTQYEPGKFVPEELQNYSVGLMFSWEVDIWKKLRNATKSALHRYMASVDAKNFMVTQLVAEIAKTYYELTALDRQLEIVEANIKIQSEAVKLIRLQKQAARVTSLAVNRFEAEVLKNRSRRYELRQKIFQTENKLNYLAGRYPQPIQRNSSEFLNLTPANLNAGVPSELLDRRPDVRAAENKLKAAKLDVKVARARFYPSLSIEAGAGYESFKSEHLFTPKSVFYSFLGNLTAPLINRQGIKADYLSANAQQIQALYEYEQTLIKAYTEVANQLSRIGNLEKTYTLKARQVSLLDDSIEVSNTLFRAARADYVEVLMTRRDALEAQMELVEIKVDQLSTVVSLYQALGGGWEEDKREE